MKKGLVFLLALFTCFMLVGCGKKTNQTNNPGNNGQNNQGNSGENNPGNNGENNQGNNGENNQGNNGENNPGETEKDNTPTFTIKNSSKELKLEKDPEKYKVNDLTLTFYGDDAYGETNVSGSYKYVLTLELGGMEINSNIYSNPLKRLINSSNLSSTFVVYAIDDMYILKSTTGAQVNGENAFLFDTKGNFIESFEDISFDIDINNRTINYKKCIAEKPEQPCKEVKYKISKDTIQKVK